MNMRTPPSLLGNDGGGAGEITPITQNEEVDFSEYMWMEQMEEFDQQVEEELLEQEMIEQGFEDLFQMEQFATEILSSSPVENPLIMFDSSQPGFRSDGTTQHRQDSVVTLSFGSEVIVSSRLNPLAPEFVPRKQY